MIRNTRMHIQHQKRFTIFVVDLVCVGLFSCGPQTIPKKGTSLNTIDISAQEEVRDEGYRISGDLVIPPLFNSEAELAARCKEGIAEAKRLRDDLVASDGNSGLATLDKMTALELSLDQLLPFISLMANVHPQKAIRDAAEQCQQDAMGFVTELSLDTDVYHALQAIDTAGASPLAQRSLTKLLKSYRRAGVDKDAASRERIAQIQQELVKTGIEFAREIREGTLTINFSEDELVGMPTDFIESHPKTEDGKIQISTDYPDFFPVVNYASMESTRRQLYTAFLTRAWPQNEENLKKLLSLREKLAQLLGYNNWADYAAETEMAKDSRTIQKFIDQVAQIARPRMQRDLAEILKRKQQDDPRAEVVETWDRFYYVNKIKEEQFGINPEQLRAYFPFQQTVDGVLRINELLFGVQFRAVAGAAVWHSDVIAYDVVEDGKTIGRFYLDMHPREGKYKHMAMFHMVEGVTDHSLPVGALVCNFPKPTAASMALMEHSDVVTLFHEFGHLMHHILAGGYGYPNLTGISCESEFVEAPSQLLEEWAYDGSVLSTFAQHYKTNAPIPEELVEKMRAAKEYGKGIHVMRQMFYAAMSLQFHVSPSSDLDLLATTKSLQQKYNPYPYAPDTYVYASFGHLTGYTSEYYSYMWSLKLAKDLLTRFQREGMLNPATAADYRDFVIRKGGSVDAIDMVEQFLGRKTTFHAFQNYLEE